MPGPQTTVEAAADAERQKRALYAYAVAQGHSPTEAQYIIGQLRGQALPAAYEAMMRQATSESRAIYAGQDAATAFTSRVEAEQNTARNASASSSFNAGLGIGGTSGAPQTYGPYDAQIRQYAGKYASDPQFIKTVAGAIQAESGGDASSQHPDPNKDHPDGMAYGLFQMHNYGALATAIQSGAFQSPNDALDPNKAIAYMVPQFVRAYEANSQYTGDARSIATMLDVERPAGFNQPQSREYAQSVANYRNALNNTSGIVGARPQSGATPTSPTPGFTPTKMPTVSFDDGTTGLGFKNEQDFHNWQYESLLNLQAYSTDPSNDPVAVRNAIQIQQDIDKAATTSYLSIKEAGGTEADYRKASILNMEASRLLESQRIGLEAGTLALAGQRLGFDRTKWEAEFPLQARQVAIAEQTAAFTERHYDNIDAMARDQLFISQAAENRQERESMFGNFYQQGQLALGRDQLQQTQQEHTDKLRGDFATALANGGAGLQAMLATAQAQRAKNAERAVPAGLQYVPGYQPGGVFNKMANMAGTDFQPWNPQDTQVSLGNPEVGIPEYANLLGGALATHPGNPTPGQNPLLAFLGGR